MEYPNIPDTYIRKLAHANGIKSRGQERLKVVKDLENARLTEVLEYLDWQFRFSHKTSALTLCKPSLDFPAQAKTPEDFIKGLLREKWITQEQIGTEWDVELRSGIQLAGVVQDGSDVYLRLVREKTGTHREGLREYVSYRYGSFSSAVIRFGDGDGVIELRCPYSLRDEYIGFVMKLMGFPQPYHWFPWTSCTKAQAEQISALLSAGLASTQVAIPSTVGSLRFNATRGTNLRTDPTFAKIHGAIQTLGLPTDDTVDERCVFNYLDPISKLTFEVQFEINIKNGGFRFRTEVTEAIIEHVLDAFIQVCYVSQQGASSSIS